LVALVVLVAAHVLHLAAVPGIAEEEEVAFLQLARRAADRLERPRARRFAREQDRRRHAARARQLRHVARVGFARRELPVPSFVVRRIDRVQPEMERERLRLARRWRGLARLLRLLRRLLRHAASLRTGLRDNEANFPRRNPTPVAEIRA